ncbi:MAG: response regulator [Chloroflexota bacterium]
MNGIDKTVNHTIDRNTLSELREKAELVLRGMSDDIEGFSIDDTKRLIHELHVYQIELELQNQSLREAQEDIQKAQEQYFHLFNFAPVGYVTLQDNGIILVANHTFQKQTYTENVNIIEKPFTDFISKQSQDKFYLFLRQILIEKNLHSCEVSLVRPDKSEFPVKLEGGMTHDPLFDKEVIQVMVSDITARKKAEEAMYNAQKLESLGIMAGGVAHDFNNLMTAINNQNTLALAKMGEGHPSFTHIEKSLAVIQRAAQLTKKLLDYTGQSHVKKEIININNLILDNVNLLEATLPSTVLIETNLAKDLGFIEADPGQIQQVIINLIINAAESYANEAGKVSIYSGMEIIEHNVTNPLNNNLIQKGMYLRIDVIDYGNGMSPQTVSKIFDPFYTTKFTGRGLGLAAVQGILKIHNGAIRLETKEGEGSRFTILLPALTDVREPEHQGPIASRDDYSNRMLLVVDDEDYVRDSLTELLQLKGFHVLAAENGQRAIQLYRYYREKISVVLCDMTMPVMSGAETIRRLRSINPEVPVIVFSGYGEEKALHQMRGLEPFIFLQKPLALETILENIAKIEI